MKNNQKKQAKNPVNTNSASIVRLSPPTKELLEREVEHLQKQKKGSGKIAAGQIIDKLIPLLTDEHRFEILAQSVTADDREKVALANFLKKHKGMKKSDFKDLLQYGEIQINDYLPEEMRRTRKASNSNGLSIA